MLTPEMLGTSRLNKFPKPLIASAVLKDPSNNFSNPPVTPNVAIVNTPSSVESLPALFEKFLAAPPIKSSPTIVLGLPPVEICSPNSVKRRVISCSNSVLASAIW